MVANEMLFGHSAHASIKAKKAKYLAAHNLDMIRDSLLTFDLVAIPVLLFQYQHNFYIDAETLLDFS